MSTKSENNKRIAKNTLLLYFRTFITMIVGLYTSRVMLQALGVDNYGINNVIGGIVAFSSLITGPVSMAISRFITYALGEGNKDRLRLVFSTALTSQYILSIIVVIVMEIAGVWFLNTQASIPADRMNAANWLLQLSIVLLAISFVRSTYYADVIAHEKMSFYAYSSIIEVVFKLGVCFAIMAFDGDRLVLLAFLNLLVGIALNALYVWYCRRHFEESKYNPRLYDKGLVKEFTSFGVWTTLSNGAWVFSTQGVSMLVNIFFGVQYNASRGIATTVNNAVQSFVGNYSMAFLPQQTKSYASGDIEYSIDLTNKSIKYSWLMMLIFLVPICMEADYILHLWLGTVPPLASLFVRLSLFESLAVMSGNNLVKLIMADGRIKRNAIESCLYIGLVFPACWLAFYLGAPVWSAYIIFILIFFTLNVIRYVNLKRLMAFSIVKHLKDSIMPCLIVTVISFIVPVFSQKLMEEGFLRFFVVLFVSVVWTAFCCFFMGLSHTEQTVAKEKIIEIMKKKHND